MTNAFSARRAALAGVVWIGLLSSLGRAQVQQFPAPIPADHFVLVVPQGEIPYARVFGLPVSPQSFRGRRIVVPRVVTLIAPVSEATEITRDWLESIAFTFDPRNLLLLQLSPQGEIVRRYVLRNTVPIYWSITLEPANKLAIETLVLYCAAGVQIDDD